METIDNIKAEFMRIYEGIAERRGLSILFGRIMAVFFLEEKELSQKQISELTGYSISSVSRSLDQMTQMGIVTKYKNPSREYFLYQMKLNYLDMAMGGIQTWINQAEMGKKQINKLRTKIENEDIGKEAQVEALRLIKLFRNFEDNIEVVLKIFRKTINELKKF